MPLVSVIIPAYNHESYVSSAVESVLGQTHRNLELIVIDDASQDGTWEILQSFQDSRLRLRRHDTNRGADATLNEGVALAQGEYIAILNSDDAYAPCRIQRLLSAAGQSSGNDVFVFSDVDFIGPSGTPISHHLRAQSYNTLRGHCETLSPTNWFFAGNLAMTTSNFFFSRSLANRVGGFFPLRYTHDWDWVLRASQYRTPIWVRENLLAYRVHEANTLSEDDLWRHIHENSYVQAKALLSLGLRSGNGPEAEARVEAILLALMQNESFHPLSLLCYLIYGLAGVEERRLLEFAAGDGASWRLQQMAEAASCPPEVFRSIQQLADQASMLAERWQAMQQMSGEIASRDRCIASQAAMIEERWHIIQQMNGEIANRDECIASQAAMIEERWHIIQQMNGEIANRDNQIEAMQAEIAKLNGNFFIRATRYLKRIWPKFLAL
ncbi:glycosyl transferase family 2 [Nitrosococcus halophilus Nc 4]|uniref:Glycosyl transferase family 2 n=1 Tax=Nitrosococcus halophilus (strain Nc4) TaxID=472759 RepID=D5C264_NITHN|nr:glycosyltransferase [Nitrosococcus halophilus]ADE16652.1 glycosyl transferase family 2 [Nitrosococcus halophilus Nc 4]